MLKGGFTYNNDDLPVSYNDFSRIQLGICGKHIENAQDNLFVNLRINDTKQYLGDGEVINIRRLQLTCDIKKVVSLLQSIKFKQK